MKKVVFAFLAMVLFLFLLPHAFTFADTAGGIQINEIMYNLKTGSDSGREWVEVYNNSSSAVDLSTYTFFENDTNHKLKLVQGDQTIAPDGYAVIVEDATKFKADWPDFQGTMFDSTFSLSNTGEPLAIKNAIGNTSVVVDQYTYNSGEGGDGDGNSLQNINGVWQGAFPTPGSENKVSPIVPMTPASATPATVTTSGKALSTSKKFEVQNIIPPTANFNYGSTAATPTAPSPQHTDNSYFLIAIVVIFIGFSAGALYSMRKSKQNPASGDDFEILE